MQRIDINGGWDFYANGANESQIVDLPHDAMIATERTAEAPSTGEQGNFQGGTYRYVRRFVADASWTCALLQLGGVYCRSHVSLNGHELGSMVYGWTPFWVDLTPALLPGDENVLEVTCDNAAQPDSRFYTGAGMHRQVWLWAGAEGCVDPRSVEVETLEYAPPRIRAKAEVVEGAAAVELAVLDDETLLEAVRASSAEIDLHGVQLWSDCTPKLYTLRVRTYDQAGSLLDEHREPFGIRKVETRQNGLFVNGEETLLRGGCIHADNGILGAASWPDAERRRVRKLKEAGFNALRSSHNPASDALVEACDEYGVYLIDETWDMWYDHKNPYDYAGDWDEHHMADVEAMCRRDRNHPSVIMWSIGNELSEPCSERGLAAEDEIVDYIHTRFPGRPVTAGINLMVLAMANRGSGFYDADEGGLTVDDSGQSASFGSAAFNQFMQGGGLSFVMDYMCALPSFGKATAPCFDRLDVAGYNYGRGRYALDARFNPDRLIVGSETFCHDIVKNWRDTKRLPNLVGDFVWAAWDYLGEAGCGAWTYGDADLAFQKHYPWLLAYQGANDVTGHPNAEMFLIQAAWGMATREPRIAVRPPCYDVRPTKAAWRFSDGIDSWSWKGCEGRPCTIEVFTDAAVVELRLNGRSIGSRRPHSCVARWSVPYQAGNLMAIAKDSWGRVLGESVLRSANDASLSLMPEADEVAPGSLLYVDVLVADALGTVEANDDRQVSVSVEGGELLGFGSACPRTEERYDVGTFTTYYGRAQAIVRAGASGVVRLVATDASGQAVCEVPVS